MIVVSDRGRIIRVPVADVLYLKAELKYVTLRTAEHTHVLDDSLAELEERLGEHFLRVHRNALVARRAVRALERRTLAGDTDEEGSEGWAVCMAPVGEWLAVSGGRSRRCGRRWSRSGGRPGRLSRRDFVTAPGAGARDNSVMTSSRFQLDRVAGRGSPAAARSRSAAGAGWHGPEADASAASGVESQSSAPPSSRRGSRRRSADAESAARARLCDASPTTRSRCAAATGWGGCRREADRGRVRGNVARGDGRSRRGAARPMAQRSPRARAAAPTFAGPVRSGDGCKPANRRAVARLGSRKRRRTARRWPARPGQSTMRRSTPGRTAPARAVGAGLRRVSCSHRGAMGGSTRECRALARRGCGGARRKDDAASTTRCSTSPLPNGSCRLGGARGYADRRITFHPDERPCRNLRAARRAPASKRARLPAGPLREYCSDKELVDSNRREACERIATVLADGRSRLPRGLSATLGRRLGWSAERLDALRRSRIPRRRRWRCGRRIPTGRGRPLACGPLRERRAGPATMLELGRDRDASPRDCGERKSSSELAAEARRQREREGRQAPPEAVTRRPAAGAPAPRRVPKVAQR